MKEGIALLACVLVGLSLVTGCDTEERYNANGAKIIDKGSSSWGYVEYDGHEYTRFAVGHKGGIAHSPKCPCRGQGK